MILKKTIHTIDWPARFNVRNEHLNFTIDVTNLYVSSIGHGIVSWAVGEPWVRVEPWLRKKGATIASKDMWPHVDQAEFTKEYHDHVSGDYNNNHIVNAFQDYLRQEHNKDVVDFLRSYIRGTKRGMDKIYFVEVK